MQTAKGVRDILPEQKALKNQIVTTFQQAFQLYGFLPLETPIIEKLSTFEAKGGAGDTSDVFKETFRLTDQGKRKLALRFDLTVPLARFVAMNPTLKMPFKRYELGRVFRDGPLKLGRYREFWQCDADIIGTSSQLADAECLAVVSEVFNKLDLEVVIKVNNRKLLTGILSQAGIKKQEEAIIAIDKLGKIGQTGVTKELNERGYSKKQIDSVFNLIKENVSLATLKKQVTDPTGKEGLDELQELFNYLKELEIKSVKFDVSLARGLAYYTGTVFEVFLKKGKITSSLAGGGRYDNMIGNFMGGGRQVPAVGLSFCLEPISDTLQLQEKTVNAGSQVYIVPIKTISGSLQIARQLREAGITTSFSIGKKGVTKNLQYANALGIPYVIILGPEEVKKNKVLLRNMKTGEESLLTLKQVIKKLT